MKTRLLSFYTDPAVGFPFLGFAITASARHDRGIGLFVMNWGYGVRSLYACLWWTVEFRVVQIKRERLFSGREKC